MMTPVVSQLSVTRALFYKLAPSLPMKPDRAASSARADDMQKKLEFMGNFD
jgi:hypothetical protein